MKQVVYDKLIKINEEFSLNKAQSHHIKNVLRLKPNEKIIVIDKSETKFKCQISNYIHNIIYLLPLYKINIKCDNKIEIELFFGIIKNNKISILLEKGTELGVNSFNPIITKYCSMNNHDLKSINLNRWRKIIKSSVQQCGRHTIPQLKEIIHINEFKTVHNNNSLILILDEDSTRPLLSVIMKTDLERINTIRLFAGPEGSFTQSEKSILIDEFNAIPVSISRNVLRSETASICSVGICKHFIEASQTF